jgi:hypothetical protein
MVHDQTNEARRIQKNSRGRENNNLLFSAENWTVDNLSRMARQHVQ